MKKRVLTTALSAAFVLSLTAVNGLAVNAAAEETAETTEEAGGAQEETAEETGGTQEETEKETGNTSEETTDVEASDTITITSLNAG